MNVSNANGAITGDFNKDIQRLKDIFKDDQTIVFRVFSNKDNTINCCITFVDTMVDKGIINEHIIEPIMECSINNDEVQKGNLIRYLSKSVMSSNDIEMVFTEEDIVTNILYGNTLFFCEGSEGGLVIDTKGWKTRAVETPQIEGVVRGPREGFVENIDTNLCLIRRKICSSQLKFKYRKIGSTTQTNICICYMENLISKEILDELNKRLDSIKIDMILESGYIEELIKDHPGSPFSTIGNTERPDVIAAKLLEGRIAIVCDGSPFVLTVPYLFIEYFQVNEDYYDNYLYGTMNRLIRFFGFFLSTSIPAIYIAILTYHQEMIPTTLLLSIAVAREGVPSPTVVEAVVMLLIFEVLREAGTRLPRNIGQTVSIIGGLVLGDAAVKASMVSAPMVIIVATTGICSFLLPRMVPVIISVRIVFIAAATVLGLYGYIFAAIAISFYMMSMKSFGVDYMAKFSLMDKDNIKDTTIRTPWWFTEKKPKFIIKKLLKYKEVGKR